ncbi:MAG TPA: DUF6766 family protein [Myxococcaceae bacterium]|nr:DUF6766 family protein [Myxococcaceae bacterium]
MKRFLHQNGLTVALLTIFLASLCGQAIAGHRADAEERQEHGLAARSFGSYLGSGPFLEAVAENWESEFLQMTALVFLASFLRQRGAADSKPLEDEPQRDEEHEGPPPPDAPRAVRRGGLILKLYSHSLSLALLALFVFSFVMHALHGSRAADEEHRMHGEAASGFLGYLLGPKFWFESFQNWQSEFLSVAVLALLSIWLRERGSPHSKPLTAPHHRTGS